MESRATEICAIPLSLSIHDPLNTSAIHDIIVQMKKGMAKHLVRDTRQVGMLNRKLHDLLDLRYPVSPDDVKDLIEICLALLSDEQLPSSVYYRIPALLSRLLGELKPNSAEAPVLLWRPFYEIFENLEFTNSRSLPQDPNRDLGRMMLALIAKARPFFAPSATREIMAEFLPLCCPHDCFFFKGLGYLTVFLPTKGRGVAECSPPFPWLGDILALWDWHIGSTTLDHMVVGLLARAARQGRVDWRPYLPIIYARLVRFLHIPITKNPLPRVDHIQCPPPSPSSRHTPRTRSFCKSSASGLWPP
eukprot:GAFH01002921.1.p1 GENE.GAFH01002921.1~~GAFH01002921.1.p1  ORF type:complete len:316 (+),score=22.64 GAFH01002921.1:39-950(+)